MNEYKFRCTERARKKKITSQKSDAIIIIGNANHKKISLAAERKSPTHIFFVCIYCIVNKSGVQ